MKKKGVLLVLLATFFLKHGYGITKALIGFAAGEVVSFWVIKPLTDKYSEKEKKEKDEDVIKIQMVDTYLELESLRAIRELERSDASMDDLAKARSLLMDMAKNHAGIFIHACRDYFGSDRIVLSFMEHHGVMMPTGLL